MKVTVFYDYNCPFCYIASVRLGALAGEFKLEIEWKGIEIHPEFPPEGIKRGRSRKSHSIKEVITEEAASDGIEFRFPGFAANSRLALEAAEFAKAAGRFESFHRAVYDAYFRHGRNIGDPAVIREIGEESGLDAAALADCLAQRTMRGVIESNKTEAGRMSVLGVPTLILGGFPVHGSQSLDTLRSLIKQAIKRS